MFPFRFKWAQRKKRRLWRSAKTWVLKKRWREKEQHQGKIIKHFTKVDCSVQSFPSPFKLTHTSHRLKQIFSSTSPMLAHTVRNTYKLFGRLFNKPVELFLYAKVSRNHYFLSVCVLTYICGRVYKHRAPVERRPKCQYWFWPYYLLAYKCIRIYINNYIKQRHTARIFSTYIQNL